MVPPGLEFQGVSHHYGGRIAALDDVSLAVEPGEVLCLLGPSGCGKTTLLRIAAGLEPLQSGVVRIAGQVVADGRRHVPPEHRGAGMLFQDYALFPHLTVLQNAAFGLAHLPSDVRRRRGLEALAQLGVADLADRHPHTLSGGQQQRAALARALAPRPTVMLLDEPFSGLDTRLREQVREDALRALKEHGAATLMVTHDPHEAMAMGDRIAVMRAGRIMQVGTPASLYVAPHSAFVAAFLGDVNRFVGTVERGTVATPLGRIDARGHAGGQVMEVMVRPEWVRLAPATDRDGAQARGTVRRARLLGPNTLVEVELDGETAEGRELRVLHHDSAAFIPGQRVLVRLDVSRALAFSLDGQRAANDEKTPRREPVDGAVASPMGAGS